MEQELLIKWEELNDQLKNYIFSKVKDWSDTRDLLQETFLKVYTKIGSLKNRDKLIPWIFTIARNEVNAFFRNKSKTLPSTEEEEVEIFNYNEHFRDCLMGFVDRLPEKYREALVLIELEGLSQKELAERLGISYSGAKSRVQRGREKLKELFTDCCDIEHDAYGNIIGYKKGSVSYCNCH